MTRWPGKLLASFVSLSVAALSLGLGAHEAAAQSVAIVTAGSGGASVAVSAGAAVNARPIVAPVQLPTLGTNLTLRPTFIQAPGAGLSITRPVAQTPTSVGLAVMANAGASRVAGAQSRQALAGGVAIADAGAQAESPVARTSLGALTQVVRKEIPVAGVSVASNWRIGRLFDGLSRRRGDIEEAVPVAGRAGISRAPGLAKAEIASQPKSGSAPPVPRIVKGRRVSKGLMMAAVAAVLLLGLPGVALAAVPAAAGASVSILAMAHPLASAFAATAGAVYGLIAAHRNGAQPSAGEVLASVLRYGLLGGAGVFALLDVTQVVFFGAAGAGVTPILSGVATAALGQSAFQGKFADASTSSADRLITAFPAVAAALGLSVGIMFAAPTALATAALGAMSLTGVASAVYAALYKPGKSAADGPSRMARGYVLQSLMTGLGLTVAGPYLAAPFLLLAAWGLWDVLSTAYAELAAVGTDWFNKSGKAK